MSLEPLQDYDSVGISVTKKGTGYVDSKLKESFGWGFICTGYTFKGRVGTIKRIMGQYSIA